MGRTTTYASRKAAGQRRVEVWLSKEVWEMLEVLVDREGSQAQAIVRAIREAYEKDLDECPDSR